MLANWFLWCLVFTSKVSAASEREPEKAPATNLPCETKTFEPWVGPPYVVQSVTATIRRNHTSSGGEHGVPPISGLNFCQVQVRLSRPHSEAKDLIEVWLPLDHTKWNGRFQATGGGGFATGLFDIMLGPAVKNGYAAASTDGGHDGTNRMDDLEWALRSDGTVNWDLLQNFATQSLVDMIKVGKGITEKYYGKSPDYSYWNGCSQGGRQGYALAQKYPQLLDGILANAPAISLTHLVMGDYWPQVAMKEADIWMSSCEFDFFRQKAMEDCDMLDGFKDGVISDPDICDFDPLHAIGQTFHCDGKEVEVTAAMADVIRKIEQGPQTPFKSSIWHGLPTGTSANYLAAVHTTPEGLRKPFPFPISSKFFQILLLRDPSFNVTTLTYGDFMALWAQAASEYGWLLDADNPDLSSLRSSGTKLLTWHGINDPIIPYRNTVRYRERVNAFFDTAWQVDKFYRLFLAPGVEHCAGGAGPLPKDPLEALVAWVENDEPPESLEAATTDSKGDLVTRDLCVYPGTPKYMGIGDPKRASSWSCIGTSEPSEMELEFERRERLVQKVIQKKAMKEQAQKEKGSDRAGRILGGLKGRLEQLDLGLRIG